LELFVDGSSQPLPSKSRSLLRRLRYADPATMNLSAVEAWMDRHR